MKSICILNFIFHSCKVKKGCQGSEMTRAKFIFQKQSDGWPCLAKITNSHRYLLTHTTQYKNCRD